MFTFTLFPFGIRLFGVGIIGICSGARRRYWHPDWRRLGGWYRFSVGGGARTAGRVWLPDVEGFKVDSPILILGTQTRCGIVETRLIVVVVANCWFDVSTLVDGIRGVRISLFPALGRLAKPDTLVIISMIVDIFGLVDSR